MVPEGFEGHVNIGINYQLKHFLVDGLELTGW
jgi:hypothetical protein